MFCRVQSEYGTQCFIVMQRDNYSQYFFVVLAVSKIITVLKFETKFDESYIMGICALWVIKL